MNKVLFLGAGASVDAGYPLTAKLLEAMEAEYQKTVMQSERRDWEAFSEYRADASGAVAAVLNASNPELVLTLPDLLEAALESNDLDNWRAIKAAAIKEDQQAVDAANKYWKDPQREDLRKAVLAKLAFQRLTDAFFSHLHCSDSLADARERRGYLERALIGMEQGDTVVTTNWDTLAERVLLDQGRWSIADGYGFSASIATGAEWKSKKRFLGSGSALKVLKLHGSTGWFRTADEEDSKLYFKHAGFLQYFSPSNQLELHHADEPPAGHGPDTNPVVAFPSYLKQLDDPILQSIWDQAGTALNKATNITFVGFSLPRADVAIRALLNPVRRRLSDGMCAVTAVVASDSEAEKRWKRFLGDKVQIVKKTAKQFFVPTEDLEANAAIPKRL
jgi:hypothetical protein